MRDPTRGADRRSGRALESYAAVVVSCAMTRVMLEQLECTAVSIVRVVSVVDEVGIHARRNTTVRRIGWSDGVLAPRRGGCACASSRVHDVTVAGDKRVKKGEQEGWFARWGWPSHRSTVGFVRAVRERAKVWWFNDDATGFAHVWVHGYRTTEGSRGCHLVCCHAVCSPLAPRSF